MDKKGITLYLAIVFGLTLVIEAVVLPTNLFSMRELGKGSILLLLILLCMPGIAANVCRRVAPNPDYPRLPYMPPSWPAYILAALLAPVLFVTVYAVITSVGLVKPDWMLGSLMNNLKPVMESMGMSLPPMSMGISTTLLVAGLIFSVLLGATAYALVALGIEAGWRGYLLPRLMPLGRIPAYLISGALWGLWFVPLIADWYYDNGLPGQKLSEALSLTVRMTLMTVVLSVVLGEIWRRKQNVGLTAVVLGGFLGQLHGGGMSMWSYLFTQVREPWTGSFGLVSILIWAIAAVVALVLPGRWAEAAERSAAKPEDPHKKKVPVKAAALAVPAKKDEKAEKAVPEPTPVQEETKTARPKVKPAAKAGQVPVSAEKPKSRPGAKPKARPRSQK